MSDTINFDVIDTPPAEEYQPFIDNDAEVNLWVDWRLEIYNALSVDDDPTKHLSYLTAPEDNFPRDMFTEEVKENHVEARTIQIKEIAG